jgi:hypothetical protein
MKTKKFVWAKISFVVIALMLSLGQVWAETSDPPPGHENETGQGHEKHQGNGNGHAKHDPSPP